VHWLLLPLALGLLLLILRNARRTRTIERYWERALSEYETNPQQK
jgi:hypothetical protein